MRKITSLIMIIIVFFVVVLSTFYIAHEYHHECDGDECPICILIEQCENTLKQIKDGIPSGFHFIIPLFFVMTQLLYCVTYIISETLVSNKIRMNN